jgi:PAS domain S-box-containing protein
LDQLLPVNLLLVDDEPKNLTALASVLEAPDRRLIMATSGQEALKCLLRDDFAAILLDVHMPELDGFETAELIRGRDRTRDTPIIFLTAAIRGEAFIARGYSLGAVDYILKPFDPDILRSKVAVFVELFRQTAKIRQQADQLAETSTFLNSVLESSTEYAIIATDLGGRLLSWNEGARLIYGYTAEEMVDSDNLRTLYPKDDVALGQVDEFFDIALRRGKIESEMVQVRKSGHRFSASVTIHQRKDASGEPVGFVCIARDITRLKREEEQRAQLVRERIARAEAEAARDWLQQVVDALPEGIAVCDERGVIHTSNAVTQYVMGAVPPAVEVSGYASLGICHLDGTPCPPAEVPLARSVQRGDTVHGEQLLITHAGDGRQTPVLVNSAPLRSRGGTIVGAVMVFQDITAIKDLEQQKDAFLAATSHDLRNPLTAIKARVQMLERRAARLGTSEGDAIAEGLRSIDNTSNRISGMINELLDVARLRMGRPLDLDRQPMDLNALAFEVADGLRSAADRHNIIVESAAPRVVGDWDRPRLERVLANLVSNAIKYSPHGGDVSITIDAERENGSAWAILRVSDEGIGIPEQDLPRVFESYYRASNVAGRIEGAGVGLAAVRQVIEEHGGSVEVASREHVGSTFTVRLPLAPASSAA